MANEKTASSFESHNKFTFSSSIDKEAKIRVRDTGNIKEGEVD